MATKKFSPAQIAAQKLFAERARAGTLGKGNRKAAVKRKTNPVTETLIYGLAPGETRDYMEELMYAGGQKLTQEQIDKVLKAAGDAGYHSFRVAGFDPTMKPDFAAAVRRKRNPEKVTQVYTVFHRGTSNVAGTVRETSPKAAKEKIANRLGLPTLAYLVARKGERLQNPDKSKPRAYVKRASQITGAPPSKRLQTRRKMALKAPAGYFPNPSTNIGLAIYLDAIAQGDTYSESKLVEALDHPALSTSDRAVIKAAIRGAPYNHTDLHHAAVKIRNYMGGQLKYSTAAVNKAIASSRSKISASEGKTIHRLLKGRHGNPATAMMTGYQVICMHPKKHVVGIFKTMAEAKLVARAMADAKGVAYAVKTVKVHKSHFAV